MRREPLDQTAEFQRLRIVARHPRQSADHGPRIARQGHRAGVRGELPFARAAQREEEHQRQNRLRESPSTGQRDKQVAENRVEQHRADDEGEPHAGFPVPEMRQLMRGDGVDFPLVERRYQGRGENDSAAD